MSNDFNLFIIWANGRHKESDVLTDIRKQFDILNLFEITWTPKEFNKNLARFYGKKLPNALRKKKLCGTGSFLVVCVNDSKPSFHDGKNMNMVMAKARYRQLLNGNYLHASDNQEEAEENLLFLTGMSLTELTPSAEKSVIRKDLPGAPYWANKKQLANFINKLPHTKLCDNNRIETSNLPLTCRLLNARKKLFSRNSYRIPIDNKQLSYELHYTA